MKERMSLHVTLLFVRHAIHIHYRTCKFLCNEVINRYKKATLLHVTLFVKNYYLPEQVDYSTIPL